MKFTSNPGRVCFGWTTGGDDGSTRVCWEPGFRLQVLIEAPSRPSYDTFLGTTVPNTIPKTGIYISAPKEPKKNDFTRENLISYKPQKKITWPRFSNVSHCSARLWQRICISVNSSKPMSQSTRHSAISSTCCRGGKVGFVVRWVDMILANCIQKHTRDTNKKNTQKQHMFKQKKRPSKNPSTSLPQNQLPPINFFPQSSPPLQPSPCVVPVVHPWWLALLHAEPPLPPAVSSRLQPQGAAVAPGPLAAVLGQLDVRAATAPNAAALPGV